MRMLYISALVLSVSIGFGCSHEETQPIEAAVESSDAASLAQVATAKALELKSESPCASSREVDADEMAEINSDTKATKTNPTPKADCVVDPEYLQNK